MQFDLFQEDGGQSGPVPGFSSSETPEISARDVLCWSKMQAEAGQPLEAIMRRKELERAAGNGLFYWGIGNSLGQKVEALKGASIPMIFSKMLSKPKAEDASPGAVCIWTAFLDRNGRERDLPDHSIVTSRAYSSFGQKTHHYALVCHSGTSIGEADGRPFNPDAYRNYRGAKLGPSQVTALLEAAPACASAPGRYAVDIEVSLLAPYCVRLVRPVLIDRNEQQQIMAFGEAGRTSAEWHAFAKTLRQRVTKPARNSVAPSLRGAA